jgi:hypothetical protein
MHVGLPGIPNQAGFWSPECLLSGVRLCVEYMSHGAHGVLPLVGEDSYKVPQMASWPVLVCWLAISAAESHASLVQVLGTG